MKLNLLFLIVILSICHSLFSMEDFSKNAQNILDDSKKAQAETEKNIPDALKLYTKVINTKLPALERGALAEFDPYSAARFSQQAAANKIKVLVKSVLDTAKDLAKKNKYDEAFTVLNNILNIIPTEEQEKVKKLNKDIETEETKFKKDIEFEWEQDQLTKAQEFATAGNYNQAYQILNMLEDKGVGEATKVREKIENEKFEWEQDQLGKAQVYINARNYDAAYAILNMLEAKGVREAIKAKEKIEEKKQQEAAAAVTLARIIVATESLKRAEEFAGAGNYNQAYQILDVLKTQQISREITNRATQLETRIKEQQELARQQQLANAQREASLGNYDEAYRILDILREGGYLPANVLKNQIIEKRQAEEIERRRLAAEEQARQEVERQRQEQERLAAEQRQREEQARQEQERQRQQEERRAQEEAEQQRLAREAEQQRLEQERLAREEAERARPSESLDLKNTLISLTNSLKLITKYIVTSPAIIQPSLPPETKPLEALRRIKPTARRLPSKEHQTPGEVYQKPQEADPIDKIINTAEQAIRTEGLEKNYTKIVDYLKGKNLYPDIKKLSDKEKMKLQTGLRKLVAE